MSGPSSHIHAARALHAQAAHGGGARPVGGRTPRAQGRGFTLVELMIAVLIIGVLAALAYPVFIDAIRKSRRAEAFTAMAALQQAQERWRSRKPAYTTTLANTAAATEEPNGLGINAFTASRYYELLVSDASATGYTATATAVSGTSQAGDRDCKVLGVRATAGGNLVYGSGAMAIDWASATPDAGRCWAR